MRTARYVAVIGAMVAGCGGGGGSPDASPPDAEIAAPGQVRLAWALVDGDEEIACEDVGATSLSLTAIPIDGFVGEVRTRRCDEGAGGVLFEVAPGVYAARFELLSRAGRLGAAVQLDRLEVLSQQEVLLDPITFDVPRRGGASFRVQARPFADNCGGDGAAPIEAMRIELHQRGGDCVPIRFEIDEGAGVFSGGYESECEGELVECIEDVQRVSFEGAEPASYVLDVIARDEGGNCYGRRSPFEVSGGGLERALGTLLLVELEGCGDFAAPGPPDGGVGLDAGIDFDAGLDAGLAQRR